MEINQDLLHFLTSVFSNSFFFLTPKTQDDDSFNLHNSNSTHQERDINRNFDENEIPQENGNASVISQQIIRSSTLPQTDVLSSSLEAEHRLIFIFSAFSTSRILTLL